MGLAEPSRWIYGRVVGWTLALMMVGGIAAPTLARAQAAQAPGSEIIGPEKRPVEFGFEERFRSEGWNNTDANGAVNDRWQWFRFKTRAWITVPLLKEMTFAVGVVNEMKKQSTPDVKFNGDEVLFDTLYVEFGKLFVKGLSARVGRQNLQRGEGFVLMDGTPGDGSRSLYSNAIDLAYSHGKSKVELMLIDNPSQDRMLPVGNEMAKYLSEWETKAVGLYYTGRELKSVDVDAYYFYADEVDDVRATSNPQYQPERRMNLLGARFQKRLGRDVTATTEFAGEWGKQASTTDIRAWGGYGWIKKQFDRPNKPYVMGGYWAMSGDDPKTANVNEGWDPLFSRWPKWSELYIYSLLREKGIAYWSNLLMWQAEAGASPWKRLAVRGTVYGMRAQHAHPGGVFGAGTGRGLMAQGRVDLQLNERAKGHVVYERLFTGDFYAVQSPSYFLRAELSYQMKWKWRPGRVQ